MRGNNRGKGMGSRVIGLIDHDALTGHAVGVAYSYERDYFPRLNRLLHSLHSSSL